MPVYGPNSWGTSASQPTGQPAGATIPWGGTGSPGSPVTGTIGQTAKSNYVFLTGFGFSIPTPPGGQGVQTITAQISTAVHVNTGSITINDYSVYLLIGNALGGSEQSTGAAWGGTNNYPSVGDSVWGPSTSYTDVNDSGFGLALSGQGVGTSGNCTGSLVAATITVSIGLIEVPLPPVACATNDQVIALRRLYARPTPVPYRNSLRRFPPRRRFGPTIFTQTRTLRFERPLPLTFGAAA